MDGGLNNGLRGGFRGRGRGRGRGGRRGAPPEGPIDDLKLYVGQLSWNVDDAGLKEAFQLYGSCEVPPSTPNTCHSLLQPLPFQYAHGGPCRQGCALLSAWAGRVSVASVVAGSQGA